MRRIEHRGEPVSRWSRSTAAFATMATVLLILSAALVACSGTATQAPASTVGAAAAPSQVGDIQSQITKVPVDGSGSYFDVSVAGLAQLLQSKDFPLINVHIPYEGEIEPTDAFIPYNEIDRNLTKLPADKGAMIVLYCRSGSMSATAARDLVKRGYTNVYNLDGGMIAWKAAGNPLSDKKR